MIFQKVIIEIYVGESKLTPEQRQIADKSNTDCFVDHPLIKGCEDINDMLEGGVFQSMFNYLGEGSKAVEMRIIE